MVRIRGRIGDWPVDLTLELDAEDWAQLAQRVAVAPVAAEGPSAAPVEAADALWQTALQLVRDAGQVEGPRLLAQLAALDAVPIDFGPTGSGSFHADLEVSGWRGGLTPAVAAARTPAMGHPPVNARKTPNKVVASPGTGGATYSKS